MGKKSYRNKGSKNNLVVSIEGAHGVGKTTIYNLLKKKMEDDPKFKFFPERYVQNPPFPFGSHNKQIAFKSEFHFLQQFVKRDRSIRNFDEKYNGRICVLDRTPICVLVYSKSLNLNEKDYNLILNMYKSLNWIEDYIIYLTAEPDTILKRIIQRGSLEKWRKEWNEGEKEYLVKIMSHYNYFLKSEMSADKLFIVNTEDLTPEEALFEVLKILTDLSGSEFKKQIKQAATQMNLIKYLK